MSKGCVELLIDLAGRCHLVLIRGNHEEMLFNVLESRSELHGWLKFGGNKRSIPMPRTADPKTYRATTFDSFASSRPYFETDQFIFVHASYNPDNKSMSGQSFRCRSTVGVCDSPSDEAPQFKQIRHRRSHPATPWTTVRPGLLEGD